MQLDIFSTVTETYCNRLYSIEREIWATVVTHVMVTDNE